jgi:hypothetical protein
MLFIKLSNYSKGQFFGEDSFFLKEVDYKQVYKIKTITTLAFVSYDDFVELTK